MIDARTPGKAFTNDHVPSTTRTQDFYAKRILEAFEQFDSLQSLNMVQALVMPSLYTNVPDTIPIYSENGITVQNPAVGFYHHMYSPICHSEGWVQCPWLHGDNHASILDNELSVDLLKLPQLVRTVKDILSKYPTVFPVHGILMRFTGPSTSYMSNSLNRMSCAFEFYIPRRKNWYEETSVGLAAYQAIVQSLVRHLQNII
jgi:hypothetical protein